MKTIFKAKHELSDDIRIDHTGKDNRLFITVNGAHCGFLEVDEIPFLISKLKTLVPVPDKAPKPVKPKPEPKPEPKKPEPKKEEPKK